MDTDNNIWKREILFSAQEKGREKWTLEKVDKSYEFHIDVRYGKKCDISSLKKNWPFQKEIELTRRKLDYFERKSDFFSMEKCPVCSSNKSHAEYKVNICGVDYMKCRTCGHYYATVFPSLDVVKEFYKEHLIEDPYYISPDEIALRLKEIYLPKRDWIVDVYKEQFGKEPRSILDFGAGSGHFLFACKKMGMKVAGIELDKDYVNWCKEQFHIELCQDIGDLHGEKFDVVCSFNVIEHTYEPNEFVREYKAVMHERSLAVIETPRAESLTTRLQSVFPDEPRGMLIPYEHNHLFTDASLATLLFQNGLAINSIWYFGQDVSELILRIGHELNSDTTVIFNKLYESLQRAIDLSHCSDLMLVAAIPYSGGE